MRRIPLTPLLVLSIAAAPLLAELGCAAPPSEETETSEQAATAEDLALAKQILVSLGGPNGKCKGCHAAEPEND